MPTATVLPDAELLVRTFLVGRAAVSSIVGTDGNGEVRVYTIIPKPAPATPFVRLIRIAGVPQARRNLDRPVIQFDAYGGTKAQARTLLATIYAELEALEGTDVAGVTGYGLGVIPGGMRYLPDPDLMTSRNAARERYVGAVELAVRTDR